MCRGPRADRHGRDSGLDGRPFAWAGEGQGRVAVRSPTSSQCGTVPAHVERERSRGACKAEQLRTWPGQRQVRSGEDARTLLLLLMNPPYLSENDLTHPRQ